jgi:hypothetical protein
MTDAVIFSHALPDQLLTAAYILAIFINGRDQSSRIQVSMWADKRNEDAANLKIITNNVRNNPSSDPNSSKSHCKQP